MQINEQTTVSPWEKGRSHIESCLQTSSKTSSFQQKITRYVKKDCDWYTGKKQVIAITFEGAQTLDLAKTSNKLLYVQRTKETLFKEIIDDMMISPQTDNINKEIEIIKRIKQKSCSWKLQ